MSDGGASVDFRGKFLKLFGYTVIAVTIGIVVWGVVELGSELGDKAVELRCKENLRSILQALDLYRTKFHAEPAYLTALLPVLDGVGSKFRCPADPNDGTQGCRPAWLKEFDGDGFAYVDLDGPTLDPERDSDKIACSYLYVANGYPCGLKEFETTWKQEFDATVAKLGPKRGPDVPLVRCYYHLPQRYTDPDDPTKRYPDLTVSPTFNITSGREVKTYSLDWQSDLESPSE
jgi:hypothetical protein